MVAKKEKSVSELPLGVYLLIGFLVLILLFVWIGHIGGNLVHMSILAGAAVVCWYLIFIRANRRPDLAKIQWDVKRYYYERRRPRMSIAAGSVQVSRQANNVYICGVPQAGESVVWDNGVISSNPPGTLTDVENRYNENDLHKSYAKIRQQEVETSYYDEPLEEEPTQ